MLTAEAFGEKRRMNGPHCASSEGSGSFEDAGPFQVVAMEEEAQTNFMHNW